MYHLTNLTGLSTPLKKQTQQDVINLPRTVTFQMRNYMSFWTPYHTLQKSPISVPSVERLFLLSLCLRDTRQYILEKSLICVRSVGRALIRRVGLLNTNGPTLGKSPMCALHVGRVSQLFQILTST